MLTPDSSRFWPADGYAPGSGQPSFDKQYVRDWAAGTGWDKTPPAPAIPDDVVAATRERYVEAYERIAGEPFVGVAGAHGAREGARADPAQGRHPRSPGPGRGARAAGARLRGVSHVHVGRLIELDVEDPSDCPRCASGCSRTR